MKIEKNRIKSILFITLSNLGDIVLTTPVLQKLCSEFPDAEIDVIAGRAGKEIFSPHPNVKEVIVYERRTTMKERFDRLIKIRKEQYDLVVDLKNSLIPYLSGAPYRTGLFGPASGESHKKREHLSKLLPLGIDAFRDAVFFLPCSDDDIRFAERVISGCGGKKTVLVNPGAKSHLKRWDALKFGHLIEKLARELSCSILVCGNEDDRETVQQVIYSSAVPAEDLCCKTTVGALAALMKKADLVITNDSAPLHIASAVNAPTLAIFGPSSEKKYGPLSDKSKVIKPDVPCRPCEKALCAIGPGEGCISSVTIDEVFDAAKELIGAG